MREKIKKRLSKYETSKSENGATKIIDAPLVL
jgi:hypothetical protein